MSRLRALLSVGRRTIGAGATTPAGAGTRSGGVDRRGLLGLIAAAPVVLPAAVRAAAAPAPLGGGARVDRALGTYFAPSAEHVIAAQPTLADIIRVSGLAPGPDDLAAIEEAAERALPDFPNHRLFRGSFAAGVPTRLLILPDELARPFIDDVGSGP